MSNTDVLSATISEHKGVDDFTLCQENTEIVKPYHLAGCGETVETLCRCTICGRLWREVYIFACNVDNSTDEML